MILLYKVIVKTFPLIFCYNSHFFCQIRGGKFKKWEERVFLSFFDLSPLFKKWEERVFLSFFEFISSNLTEKNCQIRGTGNSYFFNFRTSICVFNVFSGMSLLSIGLGGNRIYWPQPKLKPRTLGSLLVQGPRPVNSITTKSDRQ